MSPTAQPTNTDAAHRKGWAARIATMRGKEPVNPYSDPAKRAAWERGFQQAGQVARNCVSV